MSIMADICSPPRNKEIFDDCTIQTRNALARPLESFGCEGKIRNLEENSHFRGDRTFVCLIQNIVGREANGLGKSSKHRCNIKGEDGVVS